MSNLMTPNFVVYVRYVLLKYSGNRSRSQACKSKLVKSTENVIGHELFYVSSDCECAKKVRLQLKNTNSLFGQSLFLCVFPSDIYKHKYHLFYTKTCIVKTDPLRPFQYLRTTDLSKVIQYQVSIINTTDRLSTVFVARGVRESQKQVTVLVVNTSSRFLIVPWQCPLIVPWQCPLIVPWQ